MTMRGSDGRWMRRGIVGAAALAAATLAPPPVGAQTVAQLSDVLGAGKSALGGLGGAGLPAVDQASPSNIAGVLEYCLKHKYLGGGDASAGSSVLGKLTGSGKAKDDGAFKAGSSGLLETGGGDTFSLGGSGIQEKVTDQVCDLVLKHAQSLL